MLVRDGEDHCLTLCFHGVGEPRRDLELGEANYWLTEELFQEILEELVGHPRKVRLTFDDSNESDFTHALPALAKLGMSAEFFVIAGRVDSAGSLSSEQLGVLRDAGMQIGTHGMWHRRWREVKAEPELHEELVESSLVLERILDRRIVRAAMPFGSYDRRVLRELRRVGFTRVYSVDGGMSRSGSWLQSRYAVCVGDSSSTIRSLLDNPNGPRAQQLQRECKKLIKRARPAPLGSALRWRTFAGRATPTPP